MQADSAARADMRPLGILPHARVAVRCAGEVRGLRDADRPERQFWRIAGRIDRSHGWRAGHAPWRALDRVEWPPALQPCENHVVQDGAERGAVRADPGTDDRVPPGLGTGGSSRRRG